VKCTFVRTFKKPKIMAKNQKSVPKQTPKSPKSPVVQAAKPKRPVGGFKPGAELASTVK
jgi:transposase